MASLDQLHAIDRLSLAFEQANSMDMRQRLQRTPCSVLLNRRLRSLRESRAMSYSAPETEFAIGDCGIELVAEKPVKV